MHLQKLLYLLAGVALLIAACGHPIEGACGPDYAVACETDTPAPSATNAPSASPTATYDADTPTPITITPTAFVTPLPDEWTCAEVVTPWHDAALCWVTVIAPGGADVFDDTAAQIDHYDAGHTYLIQLPTENGRCYEATSHAPTPEAGAEEVTGPEVRRWVYCKHLVNLINFDVEE